MENQELLNGPNPESLDNSSGRTSSHTPLPESESTFSNVQQQRTSLGDGLTDTRSRYTPAWQVQTDTVRRLNTEEREVADYDSVLWIDENEVRSWSAPPLSYSSEEIMFVLQYFEQVAQIKGIARVQSILQTRKSAPTSADYDDLDPLKVFPTARTVSEKRTDDQDFQPTHYPIGVPRYGCTLQAQPDVTRTWRGAQEAGSKGKTKTVITMSYHHEPLPIGTTCLEIITNYPNHLQFEFLDAFIQHNFGGAEVWRVLNNDPTTKEMYIDSKIANEKQPSNFMNKRIERRMKVNVKKHGLAKARRILEDDSKIMVRALGAGLMTGSSKMCSVTHFEEKLQKAETTAEKQAGGEDDRRNSAAALAQWKPLDPSAAEEPVTWNLAESDYTNSGKFCGNDGHLGPFRFWQDFEEFDTFMEQVKFLDDCSELLMHDLVSIDPRGSTLDDQHQWVQAQQLLADFIDHHGQRHYLGLGMEQVRISTVFDYDSLTEQLEAELEIVLQGRTRVIVPQQLTQQDFEAIKHAAKTGLITFHRSLAQLLATESYDKVLANSPMLLMPEDLLVIEKRAEAEGLVVRTWNAIEAQADGSASLRQLFYLWNPWKNAVAEKLRSAIESEFGGDLSDDAWLNAMLDETHESRVMVAAMFQSESESETSNSHRVLLLRDALKCHDDIFEWLESQLSAQTGGNATVSIVLGEISFADEM